MNLTVFVLLAAYGVDSGAVMAASDIMTKMVWSQGGHIKRRLLYFVILCSAMAFNCLSNQLKIKHDLLLSNRNYFKLKLVFFLLMSWSAYTEVFVSCLVIIFLTKCRKKNSKILLGTFWRVRKSNTAQVLLQASFLHACLLFMVFEIRTCITGSAAFTNLLFTHQCQGRWTRSDQFIFCHIIY